MVIRLRENQMRLFSSFEIVLVNDTMVVLRDLSIDRYVTHDADNVVDCLQQILPGSIGIRSVYYRDSDLRFDRILVREGKFDIFKACTENQQKYFSKLENQSKQPWYVYGCEGNVSIVGKDHNV